MSETEKLNNESNTATPYDDVHRTMLNDCPKLIIPVVNEMFHKRHNVDEKITVLNNEFFVNRQGGVQTERITDTHFLIGSDRYHLERQSSVDGTIMYRIFVYEKEFKEYDTSKQKLSELTQICEKVVERLNVIAEKQEIDSYTRQMITDMSTKVLEHLAKKYSKVKEGVGAIMGGKILDYPAKDLVRKGERNQLKKQVRAKLERGISIEKIAEALEEDEKVIEEIIKELKETN